MDNIKDMKCELSDQPLQQFFCCISMWDSLPSKLQRKAEDIVQDRELLSRGVPGCSCNSVHSLDFVQIHQLTMSFQGAPVRAWLHQSKP